MILKVTISVSMILLFFFRSALAQLPEQDCSGALVELKTVDTFLYSYVDEGQFQELTYGENTSCLLGGEENSVWIRFEVCVSDTLEFLIIPNAASDDYDWALYDITNKTCEEAVTQANELRCNYSAIPGATGLDEGYTDISVPANGWNRCAPIVCNEGQEFLLMINNHANTLLGYVLSFDGNVTPCEYNAVFNPPDKKVFTISPNPSSGTFYLSGLPSKREVTAKVIDLTGRVRTTMNLTPSQQQIDLTDALENGIYILRIISDGEEVGSGLLVIEE